MAYIDSVCPKCEDSACPPGNFLRIPKEVHQCSHRESQQQYRNFCEIRAQRFREAAERHILWRRKIEELTRKREGKSALQPPKTGVQGDKSSPQQLRTGVQYEKFNPPAKVGPTLGNGNFGSAGGLRQVKTKWKQRDSHQWIAGRSKH